MNRLTHIHIEGFKSIREADLDLRPLNVLIGANASGKSNLLSLFRIVNPFPFRDLQLSVARAGGAESLLHYGSKTTTEIIVALDSAVQEVAVRLQMRLAYAPPDTLVFAGAQGGYPLSAPEVSGEVVGAANTLAGTMARWGFYHLQDTSDSAAIHKQCYVEDNRDLQPDAANLAPCLYLLRETARPYYDRIVRTVQLAFPEFDDFDVGPLELNPRNVMLNWREVGRDKLFGPHDLSDGTLRFMALATLLLQPEERLPELILIDEPELGLHPSAMELLGGMLRSAAALTQVIVATQSVRLVDEFDPEDIVVTERWEGATAFRRLDPGPLAGWLEDYSIGELWEKNVVGGRP
jgi:predicted ATPase